MKGEPLEKPPPLILPPAKLKPKAYSKHSSFKDKKSLEERAVHKFTARYDTFHGILKRVSDMKLSGSLDSEEPSTESEKSAYSTATDSKKHVRSGSSSIDDHLNCSPFEDESSSSSITGSDQCPPYEEIPRVRYNRYSCISLPSPPPLCERIESTSELPSPLVNSEGKSSFRESLPPPPSPSAFTVSDSCRTLSLQNSRANHKARESLRRQTSLDISRPTSLYSSRDHGANFIGNFISSDVNDNCTKFYGEKLSLEEEGSPEKIADSEIHQLEMFFKSLKTDVFICGTPANLYVGWKGKEGTWTHRHTGVVVVILDYGNTRSRSKRRIQIVLAERGTCFPLWKDTIDNLSAYHKSGTGFHTMYLSSDHRQIIGLSFNSPSEADKLQKHIENLTSNPENINISVPGFRKKTKSPAKKKAAPLPHKKNISNPCLFQHVTSIAAKDKPVFASLQTLLDDGVIKKEENIP